MQSCFFTEVRETDELIKQANEKLEVKKAKEKALLKQIEDIIKNESIDAYFAKFYSLSGKESVEAIRATLVDRVEAFLAGETEKLDWDELHEIMKKQPSRVEAELTTLSTL